MLQIPSNQGSCLILLKELWSWARYNCKRWPLREHEKEARDSTGTLADEADLME
jgi:hypothetical protein